MSDRDDAASASKKKKPLKLEWQGGLLSNTPAASEAAPVSIRGQAPGSPPKPEHGGLSWKGTLKIRREVKGRGGKPVALLHDFSPGASEAQKATLCRTLKERLGCGGTVEEGNVLVQVDTFERLAKALEALGVRATRGGGFS